MLRSLLAAVIVAVASIPVAASGAPKPNSPVRPKLSAQVSARAIALKSSNGLRVRYLFRNTYRIVVKDLTRAQNFHLIGPGVNLKTKVRATGTASWTVELQPGTYVYRSDKSSKLQGTFNVKDRPPPVG